MYLRISLFLFIVLLLSLSFLNISYSQQVNLTLYLTGLKQIADIRIDDFYNPALYYLRITNYETLGQQPVYLTIIIEIVETISKYSHLKFKTITLDAKPVLISTSRLYTIWSFQPYKTDIEPVLESILTENSGLLLAGTYRFKIELRSAGDDSVISSSDYEDLIITMPQPPELIFPLNNCSINESHPNFQWFTVAARPELKINYHLKIAEILENQTPEESISNLSFYETKIAQISTGQNTIISFNYPIEVEPLSNNRSYVWQVQAFDNYGRPVGGAQGKSKIYKFNVEQALVDSSEVEIILEFRKQ